MEHAYGALTLPPPLDRLRHALRDWAQARKCLNSTGLISHLNQAGLAAEAAQALSAVPVPLPACAATDAQPADAEAGWWHIYGLINRGRLMEEVAQAERDFTTRWDKPSERRLIALKMARDTLLEAELQQMSRRMTDHAPDRFVFQCGANFAWRDQSVFIGVP